MPLIRGIQARDPASSPVGKSILSRLGERSLVFLFPSQVAANSWAAALVGRGPGALETDRFRSWDSFLEESRKRAVPPGKARSDQAFRLLWAASLAERQARRTSLPSLVPAGRSPPASLVPSLARMAPKLPFLAEAYARLANPPPGWSGDRLADLRRLEADYRGSLGAHGRFEASWLPAEPPADRSFLAFFPGLFPGWRRLSDRLSVGGSLEVFEEKGKAAREDWRLRQYASFRDELSAAFSALRGFLDSGLRPEDLALSLPSLDAEVEAYLSAYARDWGVPIAFRSGRTLSDAPLGALLSALQACRAEGFSLRTLRSLLRPSPLRWKRAGELATLLRFGEQYRMPESASSARSTISLWKESLRACGAEPSLFRLFGSLVEAVEGLGSALSFAKLRAALYDFRSAFLDEGGLSAADQATVERSLVELAALEAAEADLGAEAPSQQRLGLLVQILSATGYAPSSREAAVPVYPYEVGALCAASVHFVLDLSQDAARAARTRLTGLPRELLEQGSEDEGGWDDAVLLSALGSSGAVYCHAAQGLSGYTVPHPFLMRLRDGAEPDAAALAIDDAEARAWASGDPRSLPPFLSGRTKEGSLRGLRSAARAVSTSSAVLDSSLLFGLPACDARPRLKFSPTRLKDLVLCPFRWFSSCLPELKAPPPGIWTAEGNLAHALVAALLGANRSAGDRLAPRAAEELLAAFDELFPRVLEACLAKEGPSLRPALELLAPKLRARMRGILEGEAEFEAEGWGIGEFEQTLSADWADLGLKIEGRADRLAPGPGEAGLAIVDYKRNNIPKRKDYLADEEGGLGDFQLAAYAAILSSRGRRVGKALYWSVETGRQAVVFGKGGERTDWEAFAPERRALEAALASAAERLRTGSFLETTPSRRSCQDCGSRALCRALFASERP